MAQTEELKAADQDWEKLGISAPGFRRFSAAEGLQPCGATADLLRSGAN